MVMMEKEGAKVPTFGKGLFAVYETQRAVGADSNIMIREKQDAMDIVLDEHDLAAPVDHREQAESMFNEEAKAAKRATQGIALRRERYVAELAQDSKIYPKEAVKKLTAATGWGAKDSNPLKDIEAGMEVVRNNIGLRPNVITLGASVMALLRFHPALQVAIGANERKRITEEMLKDLFQVDSVLIGQPRALSQDGKTVSDLWADNVMLHYVSGPQAGSDSADEHEPSFGYTFRRQGIRWSISLIVPGARW
ncbi:phage protein|nr:phage protein [Candidatus Pantoea persica]